MNDTRNHFGTLGFVTKFYLEEKILKWISEKLLQLLIIMQSKEWMSVVQHKWYTEQMCLIAFLNKMALATNSILLPVPRSRRSWLLILSRSIEALRANISKRFILSTSTEAFLAIAWNLLDNSFHNYISKAIKANKIYKEQSYY